MNYAVNIMNEDNTIEDKNLLIKAIENHGSYSDGTKKVLSMLVQLAVYNEVNITADELSKQLGLSKITCYAGLKALIRDNFIKKQTRAQYELNKEKLSHLAQAYLKKQQVLNSLV